MPKAEAKNQSLSIFLIREGISQKDALKAGLQSVAAKDLGDLYFKQNPRRPPKGPRMRKSSDHREGCFRGLTT
jgi:hypothetical protein